MLPASPPRSSSGKRRSVREFIKEKKGIIIGIVLAFAYFLFGGYIPAYNIQTNFDDGEIFVGLYSHLYRYGQFFGWITALFLIRPVRHLWANEKENKKLINLILAILLLVPAVVVVIDFHSSNPAPYELKPELLRSRPELNEHFKKQNPSETDKRDYQKVMLELLQDPGNWSYARFWHYLIIYFHAFSLLLILAIQIWLSVYGASEKIRQTDEYKGILVFCASTMLISFLWLLMRTAFNYQRGSYFPAISNPAADYLLGAQFITGSLVILLLLSTTFIKEFVQAVTLAGFGFACFSVFIQQWRPEKLLEIFGKDADVINYWTIFVGIVFFSGLVVLILKLKAAQHKKFSKSEKRL